MNDVDIETMELVDYANELDAETCRACGESYQSITLELVPRPDRRGYSLERYECICGHVTAWVNGRRTS